VRRPVGRPVVSAATTKTETPTQALLARLPAGEPVLPHAHMNELDPFLAAARVGGFELPPEALELVTKALHLAELNEAHVKPPDHHMTDVHRLLSGASTAAIFDADDAHAHAMSRWERAGELLIAARGHLAGECGEMFGAIRDDLIAGPLRAAVADLLKKARSQAKTLQAFAPDFGPALLAEGNAKELQTWRDSRHLQADFEVLVRAWKTSWYQATRAGRGTVDLQFYPVRPGLWYAWTDPLAVPDESLRLGHDAEVLRIAAAASSYQLLAPSEFQQVLAAADAANPPTEATSAATMSRRLVCT
jgi:hypothetical protein